MYCKNETVHFLGLHAVAVYASFSITLLMLLKWNNKSYI
jgi:hypothetical protein